LGDFLPEGWEFCGRYWVNSNGDQSYEHPGMEAVLKNYLIELSDQVGDHNRQVLKEWKDDKQKFE